MVVGATGAIGSALVAALAKDDTFANVYATHRCDLSKLSSELQSQSVPVHLDLTDEPSIRSAASKCSATGRLQLIIVASGVLHDGQRLQPEKSWSTLNATDMERVFRINTIGPTLVAKHFLPLLDKDNRSVFAALSARVGSIKDNRLGGWYAYRSSKAGLNMMIKTLSIELRRKNPAGICIGLHPGTVDSDLSRPFQKNVAKENLFDPDRAARQLLYVAQHVEAQQSGDVLAWDGKPIEP